MSERKQTPDVLADILGAGVASSEPVPTPKRSPRRARPRQASAAAADQAKVSDEVHGWEYMVVSCQDYRGWRPRYEDGIELTDWTEAPPLYSYLKRRGREGWELVAATSGKPMFGVTDYYQLFFKRPVK